MADNDYVTKSQAIQLAHEAGRAAKDILTWAWICASSLCARILQFATSTAK